MTVEVVLAPSNEAQLSELLANLYDPNSPNYGHWLGTGEFNSRFAPSAARIAAIQNHLRASGLTIQQSSSPFLVRASGPSGAVATAFATALRTYRNPRGIAYFSNAAPINLPENLTSGVLGVVGLSNTVRAHPRVMRAPLARPSSAQGPLASSSISGCQTPYPTIAQLFSGQPYPFGYGAGPGCNGLTPSQDNSIYGAPNVGVSGKGADVALGLFELSAYQQSDIALWARTFYGAAFTPPLVDILVDGGPLNPICPEGDTCPAGYQWVCGRHRGRRRYRDATRDLAERKPSPDL